MNRKKSLTWEESEKYLVLRHHDEYYSDGARHLVEIKKCGTLLELSPRTPQNRESRHQILPHRAYMRSGLSNAIVPLSSFSEWFEWFRDRLLHGDSYHLRVHTEDTEMLSKLEDMGVNFEKSFKN